MLPVSNDTLLRLVRRRVTPDFEASTVVGIDDLGSTTGHGDATSVTGQSSAISNVAKRSRCSRIANSATPVLSVGSIEKRVTVTKAIAKTQNPAGGSATAA